MSVKTLGFANPAAQYQSHRAAIDEAIRTVLAGDIYIQGPAHEAFERDFARFLGARHVVGVANGTDALALALLASGVEPGDKVVVPSHTAAATITAVLMADARPVFVDVDPGSYVMQKDAVEAAIGEAKAVILVHLYGCPADAEALAALARSSGTVLIEDCAQATGARINGRRAGTIGNAGCFSFFPTKNLGAIGDGGAVVTDDDALAERLRALRTYGWDEERLCRSVGWNSRLDEIQAAVLNAKLGALDADNNRRRTIAARYREGLDGLPLALPEESRHGDHVYHLFVVALDERDALRAHLSSNGIIAGIHYPVPNHLHPAFVPYSPGSLPETERLAARILSLPMYPELTDDDVNRVVAAVRSFF